MSAHDPAYSSEILDYDAVMSYQIDQGIIVADPDEPLVELAKITRTAEPKLFESPGSAELVLVFGLACVLAGFLVLLMGLP